MSMRIKTKKKIKTVIITIVVLFAALLCFFPFYWMIITSFKSYEEIAGGSTSFWPMQPTIDNYIEAFNPADTNLGLAYLNSLIIGLSTTIGTLFTASLAAFSFAKLRFRGKKVVYGILISTLMIPGLVTLIPSVMLFNALRWTEICQGFLTLIVPSIFINSYGVFMLRSFIVSIPDELLEASEIDGCGFFKQYYRIILPLIKPALITLGLFIFIGSWNNFMGQLIYLPSEANTIPLYIQSFNTGTSGWGPMMAASAISVIPIAIIYLKCQKYFVQGIATTGIK